MGRDLRRMTRERVWKCQNLHSVVFGNGVGVPEVIAAQLDRRSVNRTRRPFMTA